MSALYTKLSEIYEGMYQTFINYEEEFVFYADLLKKYKCQSVLETGCGTGNLARRFAADHFDYIGMDISEDMLDIAKRNNPQADFIKGDMRNFLLPAPRQSCIITGRSVSYLLSDRELNDTFQSIHKNMMEGGVLSFDFIDASRFLPSIKNGKSVMHQAVVKNKMYRRESFWKPNGSQKGAFDWRSVFYEEQADGSLANIGEDQSTIRAFWEEEMTTFLEAGKYKVEEIIPRPSYAFDTLVVVAKKV